MRLASNLSKPLPASISNNHQNFTKQVNSLVRTDYHASQSNNLMRDVGVAIKKSKKKVMCTSPSSISEDRKARGGATHKIGRLVVEDGPGRMGKNSNRKQGQNGHQNTHFLDQHHYHFKNKQSNRNINTNRPFPNNKSDAISTDRLRNHKQMLSPSRNIKNKATPTHCKKFLRSTQETFMAVSKNATKHLNSLGKSPNKVIIKQQPQEYILLGDHFLSINHDEADLLEQKISFNQCIRQNFPKHLLNAYHEISMEDEEPLPSDKTFEKSQSSFDSIQKIITIQRWWRSVLKKRTASLNPIIFDQNQVEKDHSELKAIQICKQYEDNNKQVQMCPLRFIESNNSNVSKGECREVKRNLNPLELREDLARQQQKVYKQLLEKLLKIGKISLEVYKEKKQSIEEKLQSEMQKINDIKRVLNQNTRIVHEMTQKIKEDCEKIDNIDGQLSKSFLDSIFGVSIEKNKENLGLEMIQVNETAIINRQKSKGCHYQGKNEALSFYSKEGKTLEEQYSQDFQQQSIRSSHIQSNEQTYNTNFGQIIQNYKKQQQEAMQIDQRAALQMGMLLLDNPDNQTIGIDTSLNGIHNFLLSFFKFYICFYKDEFLRLINMPYGYDVSRRIKFLQGYDIDEYYPEEDDDGVIYGLEDVIHEDILDEYYSRKENASKDLQSTTRRANDQFEKMHNRVLFDCFNAALNQFRPYFQINGTPYPWNYSEKSLTFYCISEEHIQEVFQKTQFKVLKWASSLCGIIVDNCCNPCLLITPSTSMEDALDLYKNTTKPSLFKARQQRFDREVKAQISEPNNGNWGMYEDQLALLYLECSDFAVNSIIQEFVLEFSLRGLLSQIPIDILQIQDALQRA